ADNRAPYRRLAGARLADHAKRFPLANRKTNVNHRPHFLASAAALEGHIKPIDSQDRLDGGGITHAAAPGSASSPARRQRTVRAVSSLATRACGVRHAGSTWVQRGAKRQPGGISWAEGTRPGMDGSTLLRRPDCGIEPSRPAV